MEIQGLRTEVDSSVFNSSEVISIEKLMGQTV